MKSIFDNPYVKNLYQPNELPQIKTQRTRVVIKSAAEFKTLINSLDDNELESFFENAKLIRYHSSNEFSYSKTVTTKSSKQEYDLKMSKFVESLRKKIDSRVKVLRNLLLQDKNELISLNKEINNIKQTLQNNSTDEELVQQTNELSLKVKKLSKLKKSIKEQELELKNLLEPVE